MRKIWMLSTANFRKSKSQTISLLILVLIAAMFLNVGLVIYSGINSFFDKRAEELYTPHFSVTQPEAADFEEQLRYIEQYPGVTEVEMQNIVAGYGDYFVRGSKNSGVLVFSREEEKQRMNPPSLVGDSLPLTGDAVYIPYFMMKDGGYEVGDSCRFNLNGAELNFTVAGGTEEILFGSMMNGVYRIYVSDDIFLKLSQHFVDYKYRLFSARMENKEEAMFLQADYSKKFFYLGEDKNTEKNSLFDISYDGAKTARTMIPSIAALMIALISIILLTVSLIIIRFRIISSIEESMTNIGALKAIGYRNRQIVASMVLQFGSIACLGGILGVILSQLLIPAITKILEPQIALVWNIGFDLTAAVISLFFVLITAVCISYLSAQRIKSLHPLIALRGGIMTHNFKKNAVQLDQSHGPFIFLLALKQLLQNKKQALMLAVTTAAVTLASVIGLFLHYNMNVERDAFVRTVAGEIPDVVFQLKEDAESVHFLENMYEREEVRKVLGYQGSVSLLVGETNVSATIVEDFSKLEGSLLVDGRYPRHPNEIALGAMTAQVNGQTIGDMITVKSNGQEKQYLITGIIQIMQNYGMNAMMTGEGLHEMQPEFEFSNFYIYLNPGIDAQTFVKSVKVCEGDIFSSVIEIKEQTTAQFGTMGDIFSTVAAGILAITVIVVILVLYLSIKTIVLRKKQELGIQKALGFTTFQLMNQIAFQLAPSIAAGIVMGAVGGYLGLNPMFVAILGSMGIAQAELLTPFSWLLAVCAALIMLAYAVSMLIAYRIRKISAYELISE